jgi:bifunctional NMN adenylyltransferase/nudix hydrolase
MDTNSQKNKRVAAVIGRMQMYHRGHETLTNCAFDIADHVVIVIGSALRARNPRIPFNWHEVKAMILATLTPEQRERVSFLPMRDYYNNPRWNKAVRKGVEELVGSDSAVTLVGFKKDRTSTYLEDFPGWSLKEVERVHDIDATSLRNVFFGADEAEAALAVLEPYMSKPVRDYLQAWSRLPEYAKRVAEHNAVIEYRKKWPAAAYLTTDALVRVGDYVLLARRKGPFGEDQWAFPGGHLEAWERFLDGSLRELVEETKFPLMKDALRRAFVGSVMLEDPLRSPRGRLVSVLHYYRFGAMEQLPEVVGRDDVKEAKWFHISELAAMEELFFEDHFVGADNFLNIIED